MVTTAYGIPEKDPNLQWSTLDQLEAGMFVNCEVILLERDIEPARPIRFGYVYTCRVADRTGTFDMTYTSTEDTFFPGDILHVKNAACELRRGRKVLVTRPKKSDVKRVGCETLLFKEEPDLSAPRAALQHHQQTQLSQQSSTASDNARPAPSNRGFPSPRGPFRGRGSPRGGGGPSQQPSQRGHPHHFRPYHRGGGVPSNNAGGRGRGRGYRGNRGGGGGGSGSTGGFQS